MFKAMQNFLILIATIALFFSACSTQSSQQSAREIKQEQEFIAKLEKLAIECKNNNATSCFDLGGILLNASRADDKEKMFDDEMLIVTQTAFFQSCELNHGDGCWLFAELLLLDEFNQLLPTSKQNDYQDIIDKVGKNDLETYIKYIKKSCDLNSANGCEALGNSYYWGKGVKKDDKLSFFYTKKGCDLAQT